MLACISPVQPAQNVQRQGSANELEHQSWYCRGGRDQAVRAYPLLNAVLHFSSVPDRLPAGLFAICWPACFRRFCWTCVPACMCVLAPAPAPVSAPALVWPCFCVCPCPCSCPCSCLALNFTAGCMVRGACCLVLDARCLVLGGVHRWGG